MFTVIIADKIILNHYKKFKAFFKPLINEDIAFCEWHPDGNDLYEMLPDIYELTTKKNQWRAVILTDDNKYKLNPFNYTEYTEEPLPEKDVTSDMLLDRLVSRIQCCEEALTRPLIRLTTALSRPHVADLAADPGDLAAILNGEKKILFYMLEKQIKVLDLVSVCTELETYTRDKLKAFVETEDQIDKLIACMKAGDASGVYELLDERDIVSFIRFIGKEDARYFDVEYTLNQLLNAKKVELFAPFDAIFDLKDTKPDGILCYAARTFDIDKFIRNDSWEKKDEHNYSRFPIYNLYPAKLDYFLFDIVAENNKQYFSDFIRWLGSALVFAGNDLPSGPLSYERVYRADVLFDPGSITRFCTESISKLQTTLIRLRELDCEIVESSKGELDNNTAEALFLRSSCITVSIDSEYSIEKLFADSDHIGLAGDCPEDEYSNWNRQFADIEKNLITYLRQPKRALKNAVTGEFRKKNTVSDERALWLNENQREDVTYKLLEDEEAAATDETISLYNTKEFRKDLKRADSQLRKRMDKRMTRKKTVMVGGIALGAFAFGFLPLLFSHLNTGKSFLFSVLFAAVALALFAGCGLLRLIGFRKEILAGFYDFNGIMNGIITKIDNSLGSFSRYLTHICDVMRGHSILDYPDNAVLEKRNVLIKHKEDIEKKIEEIQNIFASYLPDRIVLDGTEEPFEYDFSRSVEYDYDIDYPECGSAVTFIQNGSEIRLPVDYINSITLVREEFYDY